MDIGTQETFGFGMDPIIIRKHVDGIKGGVLLDVTGYNEEYVRCGHVIIRTVEDGKDVYKPMPVVNGAYGSLPENHEYAGICEASKSTAEPFVAVLTIGEVNDKALPYEIDGIKAAFKAAVPTIVFNHD
jgi:hypothetical protein